MFEKEIKLKSQDGQKAAKEVIEALACEIFSNLDEDKADQLDWTAFKNLDQVDKGRREEAVIFIQEHII